MRQLTQIFETGQTSTALQGMERTFHGVWRVAIAPVGLPVVNSFIHFFDQFRRFFEEDLQNIRIKIIRIDMRGIAVMFRKT